MSKIVKTGIALFILVFIAAWLKPSYSRFKDFASDLNADGQQKIITVRLNDYFIWAYFEKKVYRWDKDSRLYKLDYSEIYNGYLLNFHKIWYKDSN